MISLAVAAAGWVGGCSPGDYAAFKFPPTPRHDPARRELKATHDALTTALVDTRPDILSSVVLKFVAPLPFMFAGAWSAFTDLNGGKLQKGYVDELLEQIFVSSFAGDTSAMICVSWRNINDAPGHVIADQLLALPDDQQASACLQFVMKHVENVFFNPDWFQALDDKQKERLNQLASDGLDVIGSIPSRPVLLDVDFQLPASARSFQV